MTEPNDDIEITIKGTSGQMHYEILNDFEDPHWRETDFRPLRVTRKIIKIIIDNPNEKEFMRVKIKTAKQKEIEQIDKQLADLQARRAELLGVSYWCNVRSASNLYYRNLAGKGNMQFFVNPNRGWEDSELILEDIKGNNNFNDRWKHVDFVDLPDEIKLIEKDCE